jgi:AcrR family transcriptional regulator
LGFLKQAAVKPPIAPHSDEEPLRVRKKIQTRQRIADAAAASFAAKGYDAVTIAEIARLAEVSEQTVYNFFPSKELLVLDEDAAFEALLVGMIRERPAGTNIADSVRAGAHAFLKRLQARPKGPKSRGGLPCLMNTSPQVRRVWLAALDRYASSIASAMSEESGGKISPLASRLLGLSIVTIFSVILEEIGRATLRGAAMRSLNKLHAQIDDAVDRLAPALNSITSR